MRQTRRGFLGSLLALPAVVRGVIRHDPSPAGALARYSNPPLPYDGASSGIIRPGQEIVASGHAIFFNSDEELRDIVDALSDDPHPHFSVIDPSE